MSEENYGEAPEGYDDIPENYDDVPSEATPESPKGNNQKKNTSKKDINKRDSGRKETAKTGKESGGGTPTAGPKSKKVAGDKTPGSASTSATKKAAARVGAKSETAQQAVETASKIKKVVTAVVSTVKTAIAILIALVVNPVTWIVLAIATAVVIIFLSVIGISQTIGHHEDSCPSSGGDGSFESLMTNPDEDVPVDRAEQVEMIGSWLSSYEFPHIGRLNENQVIAILGTWMSESGLDPHAKEPSEVSSIPNSHLRDNWPHGSTAPGFGIGQWSGHRRVALSEFADEENAQWWELKIQMMYFVKELDEVYGEALLEGGGASNSLPWDEASGSVEDTIQTFVQIYEAGVGTTLNTAWVPDRLAKAEEILDEYGANFAGGGSGGSNCTTMGEFSGEIAELAIQLSWPDRTQSLVSGSNPQGRDVVKPEYEAAKAEAEALTDVDGYEHPLYASCDRFLATVMRLTVDAEYPWGSTLNQLEHMEAKSTWTEYTDISDRQPGDVWTARGQHIMIFVGEVDGIEKIAHASLHGRVANLDDLPSSLVNGGTYDGHSYQYFRFTG